MKKIISIAILGLIITSNAMAYEEANYEIVKTNKVYEIRKYSTKFVDDEDFAKKNKLGMWSMTFKYPWDFRKGL